MKPLAKGLPAGKESFVGVGRPFLPDPQTLWGYLARLYDTEQLTNSGPLVRELEERLRATLGVDNLLLVANGTLALQIAFRTLRVDKEAITTPFTFVATSSALSSEGIVPRYADINRKTLNLDPKKAREGLTPQTSALVPTHVYGNPCDIRTLESLAKEKNLRLIYDAAHAFGVEFAEESLTRWGDASVLSFHATKLFHSAEGGGVVFTDGEAAERARNLINFGIDPITGNISEVGLNAKMSELNAAMGLAVLDNLPEIMEHRRAILEEYERELAGWVDFPRWNPEATRNGAYAPILLDTRDTRDRVQTSLNSNQIFSRPYFFPALNTTEPYYTDRPMDIAEEMADRVLCLPIHMQMDRFQVSRICNLIKGVLEK